MTTSTPTFGKQTPEAPSMHWALVLGLSIITLGLFAYFWALRQALFVKKIDSTPQRNLPVLQLSISLILMLFSNILAAVNTLTVMRGGQPTDLVGILRIMHSFQYLMFFVAFFLMRKMVSAAYGIQMNGIMTWFFNVFYLQYHLSRIVKLRLPLIPQTPATMQAMSPAMRTSN